LTTLPTGLYYWYGTFVAGFFQGQVEDKVLLKLILRENFWKHWLYNVGGVVRVW
jgi:hypothetical protein